MVHCGTALFLVTAACAVFLGVLFYQPIPPTVSDAWNYRTMSFNFKLVFIKAEVFSWFGAKKTDWIRSGLMNVHKSLASGNDYSLSISTKDLTMDGVPVRIYRPSDAEGTLPVLIWFHGGGWFYGDKGMSDDICSYIARETNIAVVSAEYRLAPEHPFPAAFDDCLAVAAHVLKRGGSLNLDTSSVAIGGDSSGGQLAASVATMLRNYKTDPPIKAQVLANPVLQACDVSTPRWKSKLKFEGRETGLQYWANFLQHYLGLSHNQTKLIENRTFQTAMLQSLCKSKVDYKLLPGTMIPDDYKPDSQVGDSEDEEVKSLSNLLMDIRLSPMLARKYNDLPATLIVTAEWDYARDDGAIYAKHLEDASVNVKWIHIQEAFHGFLYTFGHTEYGKKAVDSIIQFLRDNI